MKRTGIKIFYWKLINYIKFPYRFLSRPETKFPKKGRSHFFYLLWLYTLRNEIKSWGLNKKLGFLYSRPHPISVDVWKKIIYLNPNNLGEWSQKDSSKLTGSIKAESDLVSKIVDLLGGKKEKWKGYVTSGATEANIFSAWIGRNYLTSKVPPNKICLILNQITHYSIKKAANIIDVPVFEIGVNRKGWNIDLRLLESKIVELKGKGYDGFLIPITLGYTQTGTNDDYIQISNLLETIQKKLNVTTFLWVDAAINGLVLPFTKNNFLPLGSSSINTFILDFHKTGMCPIPSGLIIYKQSLKKFVEQKVQYLDQNDATLLGSRSGVSAAAMLSVINKLGKRGFKRLIDSSVIDKNKFLLTLKSKNLDLEVVDEADGISLALVSKKPLPTSFIQEYGLFAKRWSYKFDGYSESLYIYKLNFIPKN